jgi:2-oxoglutarate dehydrogenase E2 component (dihydrolipoamide succinyltransferase)
MTIEIKVPQLPESITDATLVAWHKQPGDSVRRDENLADLETDKVVLEVPAPADGVLREVTVPAGTVVSAGQLLARVDEGAQTPAAATAPSAAAKSHAPAVAAAPHSEKDTTDKDTDKDTDKEKLSPSVRRLVQENRLDPGTIPASGRDGRLTKSDVVGFLGKQSAAEQPAVSVKTPQPAGARAEHRVAMTRLRQRIAQRMVEAQSTQALLTSFNEVDLTAVNQLRAHHKERFEKTHDVKLGFMSFFVKACIEALKRFPVVNAAIDGNEIVYHEYYDIGVAVSTDRGLVVPIVRDADSKGFAAIEKEIAEYAKKARAGTLAIEDLTGGTFTITNGGVFGSLMSTPIVNAPQSAILGMHKIQERPMVIEGQILIRPMMYIAITYDHRLIDGRDAVQFLVAVKECLEDPGRMLLGI